jgi:hypothetical protein
VGPFSSNRSQALETFKLDDERVEYAQINYNVMAQKPTPVDDEANLNTEGKQDDNDYYLPWPSIILLVGDDFILHLQSQTL